MFKVHIGYTAKGNSRWKRFNDLQSARDFCGAVFQKSGLVLSIVKG